VCRIVPFEHEGLCPSADVPPGGAIVGACRREELGMDVLADRVADLGVGEEVVVVCVRTPGEGPSDVGDADVSHDVPLARGDGRCLVESS
jgi:hypothetical protein